METLSLNSMKEYEQMLKYSDDDFAILDNIRFLPEINTLKIGMNIIIVCTEGRLQVDVNGKTITVSENGILFFPPNIILDNYMVSPVFECKILCMNDNIVQNFLQNRIDIWNRSLYVNKKDSITMTETDRKRFDEFYSLIISVINDNENLFSKDIIRTLIRAALLFLCSLIERSVPDKNTKTSITGRKNILKDFLSLISSEVVKHRPVSYYASKLCITPKYLTVVCRRESGKTASDWINEYVNQDINYYLKNTNNTVKEIADLLGFENLSFFGKYVKTHFGKSPRNFRKG